MTGKTDGERLARMEEAMSGIKNSVDLLRESFKAHAEEERLLNAKVDAIESDFDKLKGGAKMFMTMSMAFAMIIGGLWAMFTWATGVK